MVEQIGGLRNKADARLISSARQSLPRSAHALVIGTRFQIVPLAACRLALRPLRVAGSACGCGQLDAMPVDMLIPVEAGPRSISIALPKLTAL